MIRLGRWVAVVGSALAIAVAVGCASGAGAAAKVVSPCGTAGLPAWSPDGTQIAWYGHRWPRPNTHHGGGDIVLRAICVSDADAKHVHKVSHTVCSERCFRSMSDPPDQLYWVKPSLLLYGNDFGIGAIPVGQSPKLLGKKPPERFSVDSAGDRVSAGAVSSCTSTGCAGPVKILGVPSGAVAGAVGGPKVINTEPSLSPDGTQVVFARFPANDSGKRLGIWTASADGSHLKRLVRRGSNPLWSPAGNRIAYLAGAYPSALRLVPSQGGATTLLRKGIGALFAWSPDGRHIAFADTAGRLAVVDTTTKKVRKLLKLQPPWGLSSIAWAPDSTQMLVVWRPPALSKCPSGLWRVPISGGKPHLVHGC